MNIEMALKSKSYILDLDRVRLSFGIFFFLSGLMESFFYQLSGSTFIFVKNTHQKAANLMFCQILPVAKGPCLSLKCNIMWSHFCGKWLETGVNIVTNCVTAKIYPLEVQILQIIFFLFILQTIEAVFPQI